MTDPQDRLVTEPADLKAVAHPLRVRLLALLREHGPATATELAHRLGTESGSTSYHLRVLARHGFVAEAAPDAGARRHHRERRWAAVHRTTGWSNTRLAATGAGREAAAMMRRRQVEVLIGDVERFEADQDRLGAAWIEAAGIGDLRVRLTESSVAELWDRFYAHLDELRARDAGDPTAAMAAGRRYALLCFLLWLPAGLSLVPLVLLLLDRGLSVSTIAVVGVAYGLTTAVLELPTGGLADVLGRRPVLIASAVAGAGGLLLLGLAGTVALFVGSAVLRGAARALSTGPLEAWYVDTVHAEHGRDADLTTGLARGEIAASLALGAGTLTGGLLPLALGRTGALPALAVPVLLAAGVEVLRALVTTRLPEPPRCRPAARAVLRGVPATVVTGLRVAGRDRALTRLLLAAAGAGIALGTIELLTPAWLAGLSAGPRAGATYAVVAAAGFGADAAGGLLAAGAVRRFGSHARAAAAGWTGSAVALAGLAGCALLTGTAATVLAGAAYCLLFVGLGAAFPAQAHLLHERVEAGERATVLSVQSLLIQAAGAVAVPVIGWQATRGGIEAGYALGALILLASAGLFLRLRDGRHAPRTATV